MKFKILIGGVTYRTLDSYSIKEQAGSVSSSSIGVKAEEGKPIPKILQDVQILDEMDNPFFAGIIQSVDSPNFSTSFEKKNYNLEILSMESIFNNRIISDAYQTKTTEEIVTDLFNQYIAPEGITLGKIITGGREYDNYNYQYTKFYDILTELSEAINATFYISADKKFYFIDQSDFNYVLTPTHIKDLKKDEEKGDLRSVQIVTGAKEETSVQSESEIWDVNQSNYVLSYQVSSIEGITINAVIANIGIRGVDEDDSSITFLWSFGSNTISVNNSALIKPSVTDNVVTLYQGFFDIVITNTNDQLVNDISDRNGTSGIIERIFTDETIDNLSDADKKANDLLDQFSKSEIEASCLTEDLANSKILDFWYLDYPELDMVGEFAVVDRSISNFGENTRIKVRLKNKNFFKKYGETFRKQDKSVRRDVKVFKSSSIGDTVNTTEEYSIEHGGLTHYPSAGINIFDPSFINIFPI